MTTVDYDRGKQIRSILRSKSKDLADYKHEDWFQLPYRSILFVGANPLSEPIKGRERYGASADVFGIIFNKSTGSSISEKDIRFWASKTAPNVFHLNLGSTSDDLNCIINNGALSIIPSVVFNTVVGMQTSELSRYGFKVSGNITIHSQNFPIFGIGRQIEIDTFEEKIKINLRRTES